MFSVYRRMIAVLATAVAMLAVPAMAAATVGPPRHTTRPTPVKIQQFSHRHYYIAHPYRSGAKMIKLTLRSVGRRAHAAVANPVCGYDPFYSAYISGSRVTSIRFSSNAYCAYQTLQANASASLYSPSNYAPASSGWGPTTRVDAGTMFNQPRGGWMLNWRAQFKAPAGYVWNDTDYCTRSSNNTILSCSRFEFITL